MTIRLVPTEIDGEMGLDVEILSRDATVADLLTALEAPADDPAVFKPYHKERYARCEGCTYNCCKSNDITVDLVSAERFAQSLNLSLKQFAKGHLKLNPDLPFPEFKRRPCPFLQANRCTVYGERALICRLYLCTPMTERLEKLRCAVLLAGEAALRQRLVELKLAPANWHPQHLREALKQRHRSGEISREHWQEESEHLGVILSANPFTRGQSYEQVKLRDCCTDSLWEQLS